MNSHLAWYVARSSGIVSWALLTFSVVWGLLLSTKLAAKRTPPGWVLDLHRFVGGLSVVFLVVHVTALVADSYTSFGLTDILVPFASAWKPGPVALGVVGAWLLFAVELTSLARKRLPRKLWKWIHLSSYPLYALATFHLLTAGTDRSNPVLSKVVDLSVVLVGGLTIWRAMRRKPKRQVISPARRQDAQAIAA